MKKIFIVGVLLTACGTAEEFSESRNSEFVHEQRNDPQALSQVVVPPWTHGICGADVNARDDQLQIVTQVHSGERVSRLPEVRETAEGITFSKVVLIDLPNTPAYWVSSKFVCELEKRIPQALGVRVIEVNKTTNRLSYFKNRILSREWNVATARSDKITPSGIFKVQLKQKCPWYYGPKGDKKVPGCDPTNPLGAYALWFQDTIFGLHGTNAPWLIEEGTKPVDRRLSAGCIRNKNENITWLHEQVKVGDTILIKD